MSHTAYQSLEGKNKKYSRTMGKLMRNKTMSSLHAHGLRSGLNRKIHTHTENVSIIMNSGLGGLGNSRNQMKKQVGCLILRKHELHRNSREKQKDYESHWAI